MVPGRYTALSNDKKMVTILHRELEHKVEKVKHMKLEVMQPKTKKRGGGGGLFGRGGLIENLRYSNFVVVIVA